jgi:glycosyltransferase involved in cell wall biosynthesis
MRVGIIAPPWVPVPPPAYGGTESMLDRLARGLVAAGHEVLLAAPANSTCPVPQVPGTLEVPDEAALTGDSVTELGHVVTAYAAMGDMDVVHDHTLVGPLSRLSAGPVPVVTTNHGPFDSPLGPLYRAMREVPVIAISEHQASFADGVDIAAVIHHGVDVADIPVGSGSGGYASFLGRMSPDKGAREAILVARDAGVPLRMAAKLREPAEEEYFESQVKPLLSSEIEYVGELGHDDKIELVGDSFALLNPMQWPEPFGLVMIEALATGTPVVATPEGSAPEIIADGVTGYLRSDHEGLVEALEEAQRLDRGCCRSVAEQRFDTARMVEDHVRLYRRLTEDREVDREGRFAAATEPA